MTVSTEPDARAQSDEDDVQASDAKSNSGLVEYRAAHLEFLLYGIFPTLEGAILSTGTFVFWGFLLNAELGSALLLWSTLAITLVLSIWALHQHQSRQIYMYKLNRIHEIEAAHKLSLHTRFVASTANGQAPYHIFGPSGHGLLLAVYAVSSLGAPMIALVKVDSVMPIVCSGAVVVVVIFWVSRNERALKRRLGQLRVDQRSR